MTSPDWLDMHRKLISSHQDSYLWFLWGQMGALTVSEVQIW